MHGLGTDLGMDFKGQKENEMGLNVYDFESYIFCFISFSYSIVAIIINN